MSGGTAPRFVIVLFVLAGIAAGAEAGRTGPPPAKIEIRVIDRDKWNCEIADVEKVLHSVAGEMLRYFPDRKLPTLEVGPKGGPIVWFARGPDGEIRVRLDTGDRLWAQMSYQFAHELGHILCQYDDKHAATKWFEESICEMASIFALRRMGETWKTSPPYPNWRSYAPHLTSYAADRIEKTKLPKGMSFMEWYRRNAPSLKANPTDRDRNAIVAGALLPLFEDQPESWEAVGFLNKKVFPRPYTFPDHLRAWHKECPPKHRAFVAKVASLFEIKLPANP